MAAEHAPARRPASGPRRTARRRIAATGVAAADDELRAPARRGAGPAAAGAGRPRQPAQAVRGPGQPGRGGGRAPGSPPRWLPVVDNLERALEHAAADPAAIVEGVQAVRDQALGVLAGLGFPRRDDTGAPFDPARHEAVAARRGPGRAGRHRRRRRPARLRRRRPPAAARAGRGGQGGLMAAEPGLLRGPRRAADRQPGRDPARLPQAGPRPTTPTSTRTRPPRSGSRRSPRPTTCCPIRRPGAATTRSAPTSGRCPEDVGPRDLGSAPGPARRGPRGGGAAGRRGEAGSASGGGDVDIDDLLGGLFGGRRPAAGAGRGWGPIPGADQEAELELTVEEAYRGGRRTGHPRRPRRARARSTSPSRPG